MNHIEAAKKLKTQGYDARAAFGGIVDLYADKWYLLSQAEAIALVNATEKHGKLNVGDYGERRSGSLNTWFNFPK